MKSVSIRQRVENIYISRYSNINGIKYRLREFVWNRGYRDPIIRKLDRSLTIEGGKRSSTSDTADNTAALVSTWGSIDLEFAKRRKRMEREEGEERRRSISRQPLKQGIGRR